MNIVAQPGRVTEFEQTLGYIYCRDKRRKEDSLGLPGGTENNSSQMWSDVTSPPLERFPLYRKYLDGQ